jgi:hypothetical protein
MSDEVLSEKNFSIHRFTHSLCTTKGAYSTGYPQMCKTAGFVLPKSADNVAQVPVSGWK